MALALALVWWLSLLADVADCVDPLENSLFNFPIGVVFLCDVGDASIELPFLPVVMLLVNVHSVIRAGNRMRPLFLSSLGRSICTFLIGKLKLLIFCKFLR